MLLRNKNKAAGRAALFSPEDSPLLSLSLSPFPFSPPPTDGMGWDGRPDKLASLERLLLL